MEIDKKEIKEAIENIEFTANGMRWINGASVEVVNIRILKRDKIVIADVILHFDGDERIERYNDCEYPFEVLGIKE